MGGNITSGGKAFTTTATLYDAQGNPVPRMLTYTPTGTASQWTMQASVNGHNLFSSGITLTFSSTGQLASYSVSGGATKPVTGQVGIPSTPAMPTGFQWNETAIDFVFPAPGSNTAVTKDATSQTVGVATEDGYTGGTLQSRSIGQDGVNRPCHARLVPPAPFVLVLPPGVDGWLDQGPQGPGTAERLERRERRDARITGLVATWSPNSAADSSISCSSRKRPASCQTVCKIVGGRCSGIL